MSDRAKLRARRKRIKQCKRRQKVINSSIIAFAVVFGLVLSYFLFGVNTLVVTQSLGSDETIDVVMDEPDTQNMSAAVEAERTDSNLAMLYTSDDINALAKVVYGEAEVTDSDTEMAAVIWCILNRVDSPNFPNTIYDVITQPYQFHVYDQDNPVMSRIQNLCLDVLRRYEREKSGDEDVGRVLPKEYLFFEGDGHHNTFRTKYHDGKVYEWTLDSPYDN